MEKKKRSKWSVIGLVIGIIALIAAVIFMWFLNRTAVFADIDTPYGNYLPLSEFTLRDGFDVNKLENDTRSPFKYDIYEESYYYADSDTIRYEDERPQTSKGVRSGDTFEDFVKAYGPYIADSIDIYEPDYEGERDDEYYDTHYLTYLTAEDFLQKYSIEELIDMDAYVRVSYCAYVKGNQVAYSQSDLFRFYDQTFDTFWPKSGVFNPKMQTYRLDFSFIVQHGKLVLTTIDSSRYTD